MKKFYKILISIGIILLIGILIIIDKADRTIFYSLYIPEKEITEFYSYQTFEETKKAYEKNYGNPEWSFPREKSKTIKLYKNRLLLSRITSKTLTENQKKEVLEFFNNPENFDFSETTWNLTEAEYIFRFYNEQGEKEGELWLCLENCGMTKSIPFSPNMKFGGISETGKKKILNILNKINK